MLQPKHDTLRCRIKRTTISPKNERPEQIDQGNLLDGLARALPLFMVDYTDEARCALIHAQQRVIDRAKQDARDRFE